MSLITGVTLDSLREARIRRLGPAVARAVATSAPMPDLLVPVMRSWREYKEISVLGFEMAFEGQNHTCFALCILSKLI